MLPTEFTTVWIEDHLQFESRPIVEGWTFLTYLTALYPRFRFGHLVLSQSFRNPALLAKMAATLQALTSGRYILGIGAGWHEERQVRGLPRVVELPHADGGAEFLDSARYHGVAGMPD